MPDCKKKTALEEEQIKMTITNILFLRKKAR